MLCATIKNERGAAIKCADQAADIVELSLTRISHTFSDNSHTLSPDPHRQDSEAVSIQARPRYPGDESQLTERRFASKKCERYELKSVQRSHFAEMRKSCRKPVIFKLNKPDLSVLNLNPDYVDLPHTVPSDVFKKIRQHFPTIKSICSYHDCEKTGDLETIFAALQSKPADYYKIATYAHSTLDALRMLKLVKKHRCIGICMGELGAITRILAPVFGAPWTYAPVSEQQKTAPGQIVLKDLVRIYNYKRLSLTTSIYGLIGDPISNSPGHLVHNFAFRKLNLDAVYVKMRIRKDELEECFHLCRELRIKGLSVTMPLKQAVKNHLNYFDTKAINTIELKENSLFGWNTDGVGALNALEKKIKVTGKRIVLIGAGGSAYAIALEAKKRGAELIILNRTVSRAHDLAAEIGGVGLPLDAFSDIAKEGYDILINCTSVGMGDSDSLPVDANELLEEKVVMDIVSRPGMTSLIAAAKQKKCLIVEGMDMFIQQAVGQYMHWFG